MELRKNTDRTDELDTAKLADLSSKQKLRSQKVCKYNRDLNQRVQSRYSRRESERRGREHNEHECS